MAITSESSVRHGRVTIITVASDLEDPYYHWYADGSWLGVTRDPEFSIVLDGDDEIEITCQDTTDADYDPIANAPAGWPARKTIWWTAPADSDIDHYIIRQQLDGGAWTDLGVVNHDGSWAYGFLTARLTDLGSYAWRVVAVDAAGNEGTLKEIAAATVVRRPNSPAFSIAYSAVTQKVTFDVT